MTAERKRVIWILSIAALVLGGMIILMSFLGAGREVTLEGDRLTELRKIPIGSYKFPETGILPGNVFYPIKELRDWWWMQTSRGEQKVKLVIFFADKKWQEAIRLENKGMGEAAVESGRAGLDLLQYANQLKDGIGDEWRRGELERMIGGALEAYRASEIGQIEELEQILRRLDETETDKNN